MNLEQFIKEHAAKLKSSRRDIDIAPDIPQKTIDKWVKKYKESLPKGIKDYVLVLSYTNTGNFALTGDAMYYDNYLQGGMKVLKYQDVEKVEAHKGGVLRVDQVLVTLKDGEKLCLDGCIDGIDVKYFAEIFSAIIKYAKEFELTISKQNIPLYKLPDSLKLQYIKVLCNYSYVDDEMIGSDEYNIICKFAVRIDVSKETRKEMREYMNAITHREKTGKLINDVKEEVKNESGQWDAFRYSILQDILYIHNLHMPDKSWREDGFVGSLMKACGINPAQLDTMVKATSLNDKMQEKGADLTKLKKEWDKLIKKIRYTDGYVPSLYLICSGSVYGISCYTGFLKKDETSQEAINKQRELILHQVIQNTNDTINMLEEDMEYLADKLEEAVRKGQSLSENYREMLNRIKAASEKLKASKSEKEKEVENLENEDTVYE